MKTSVSPLFVAATLFLVTSPFATAEESRPAKRIDPQRHEAFLKKFDQDGDGRLSAEERAAARATVRKPRPLHHAGAPARLHGFQGKPGKGGPRDAFRQGYLVGRFDRDGDGRLNAEERQAVRAEREQRQRAGLERQLQRLKAIDADGDGKLSDAEWNTAKEKFQKRSGDRRPGPKPERAG